LKSGNLNLLEPYGPVQACNGIALPVPFGLCIEKSTKSIAIECKQNKEFNKKSPKLLWKSACTGPGNVHTKYCVALK
jgi:hypothetical protein